MRTLKAKTPKGAASEVAKYLKEYTDNTGLGVTILDPKRSAECGYGDCWTVVWEEGPYEWTMISAGSALTCGETGDYATPGDWPKGISNEHVFCEAYSGHVLCFFVKD